MLFSDCSINAQTEVGKTKHAQKALAAIRLPKKILANKRMALIQFELTPLLPLLRLWDCNHC
jgi:hypothetical protein